MDLTPPPLEFLFEAEITLAPIRDLGPTPIGHRRIIDITGGTVRGPRLSGRVLAGGADWQFARADGATYVDARYTLEAEDGALVYVQNRGLRHGPPEVIARLAQGEAVDPALYYFRTQALFEAGAGSCDWLNRVVAVGTGRRLADRVAIRFFAVL